MRILECVKVLGDTRILLPEVSEGEEEVNDVDAFEPAAGRGELGEHFDGSHLCVEGDLILEGVKPCLVDEGEEVGAHAALNDALASLVPRPADQFSSLERRAGSFYRMDAS